MKDEIIRSVYAILEQALGQSALSLAEAKEHIEQIRREYSLEGHDILAQALTNAHM